MRNIKIFIEKRTITITVSVDEWVDKVEFCFQSDRNKQVTRMTDISSENPDPIQEIKQLSETKGDLFFPFLDICPDITCSLRMNFENPEGVYCFEPMRCKTEKPLTEEIEIPGGELVEWENTLFVSERENKCTHCQQVFYQRPIANQVEAKFQLLSDHWGGTVSIVCLGQEKEELLSTQEISCVDRKKEVKDGKEGSKEQLQEALEDAVDFLFQCRNTGEGPCHGGMYLFYDMNYAAYRASHWNWTYGPAIGALIACITNQGVLKKHTETELIEYAKSMADVVLQFENKKKGHPCEGIPLGRWQPNLTYKHGVMGYYSIADSGFCAKWGLMPLFRYTKEQKYLDSIKNLYEASKRWLNVDEVLAADYLDDCRTFSDRSLDETMFVMGMFEELWKETGDKEVCETGLRCFDALCKTLRLEDGRWARTYLKDSKKNLGFERDTKGHGWAMDGLLCASSMGVDTDAFYLQQARDTADLLIRNQHSDGHWDNFFGTDGRAGIGEKSTALWSWLLYRLYERCGESQYRIAAQKALFWCIHHMYRGQDSRARGSIVANSVQSGIIYRPFFPMSCSYTTSFFILAAIEEFRVCEFE